MRRQSTVSFSGLCVLIFFAPFFFGSVHGWASSSLAAALFLLLALNPDALSEVLRTPIFFRNASALVFIWIVLQSFFWAVDQHEARSQGLQWLAFAALFLVTQQFDFREMRRLLNVLIGAALFQAVYGFWQMHQSPEMVLWQVKESHLKYLTGTYINRNHCAGLLELALGVVSGVFCYGVVQKNRAKAVGYGLVLVLLFTALVKTGSRFGVVSILSSLGLAGLLGAVMSVRLRRPFLSIGLFLTLIISTQGLTLFERFELDEGYLTTVSGRVWAWQDAWTMLKEYWIVGTGLGGFERGFAPYQSARLLMGWAHAHQDYLELANELGVPMLVLWLAAWLSFGLHARSALSTQAEAGYWAGGISVGLISLGVHGFMDFNFSIPANAFLWVFLAGCLERLRRGAHENAVDLR